MFSPFQQVKETDKLCQGDIVASADLHGADQIGMIITADCDLDKSKHGGLISAIRIVSINQYLNDVWSREQIHQYREQSIKEIANAFNSQLLKTNPHKQIVSFGEMERWLKSVEISDIFAEISSELKPNKNLLNYYQAFMQCDLEEPSISDLQRCFKITKILNKSEKNVRRSIEQLLHHSNGRSDIMFLPYIVGYSDIGFVLKFRDIFSISEGSIYLDSLEYSKLLEKSGFVRLGRFNDNLKYGIVQRLAILFSRIGLEEFFEEEMGAGNELALDKIFAEEY
tara:strand:+ start:223 stop:1068 length:846 start_codon:yes stop_codon:yes gene_type:complete